MLKKAADCVKRLLEEDPNLEKEENGKLSMLVERQGAGQMNL